MAAAVQVADGAATAGLLLAQRMSTNIIQTRS
jgi:hypothetical protein